MFTGKKCDLPDDTKCETCFSTPSADGTAYKYLKADKSECLSVCPDGYGFDANDNCVACQTSSCKSCVVVNNISSIFCSTCAAGQSRRLGDIGCGPCARGEIAIDISGENFKQCVSCGVTNCGVCSRVNFCTQCDSGLFIQPDTTNPLINSCVITCLPDHYLNPINNTCEKCSLLFGINC
jgi:hypothetical protein